MLPRQLPYPQAYFCNSMTLPDIMSLPVSCRAPTLAEQASVVAKPEPALVNKLKDTNKQLRAARDELANELTTLQRSTRVTRVRGGGGGGVKHVSLLLQRHLISGYPNEGIYLILLD